VATVRRWLVLVLVLVLMMLVLLVGRLHRP